MNDGKSYWTRKTLSRRAALRAATASAGGLAALSLIGCGGDDDNSSGGSNNSGGSSAATLDPKSGKPGGKLVFQAFADWGGTVLVKTKNNGIHQGASFTHSALFQLRAGRPGVDASSQEVELDLATALPEQAPDKITYTMKIRPDAKFQNGRTVTAQDVKYSYDRYAFASDSAYKSFYSWLDKVEAVDATTVKFTTKTAFADFVGALTPHYSGHVLCQEFEESAEAATRFMGSGPYIMTDRQAPVLNARYKRNPDYYDKPLPYFDEIEVLGTSDTSKKIADFSSRQTHVTYWFFEEDADQVKKNRPDALHFVNKQNGYTARMRVDQKPFNDKRVRQALSMALDRKQFNDATQAGRAEDDQWFTWVMKDMGFRKPSELPQAKYWKHDLQTATQLMRAAGIDSPFETTVHHFDPTIIGQGVVDQATLLQTQWKNAGFVNSKDSSLNYAQVSATAAIGNYDGVYYSPSGAGVFDVNPATGMKSASWSPPEGVTPPTPNVGHVNDPRLNALLEKQYGQLVREERQQTFREMEELFAEEQYVIVTVTVNNNYFADPSLKNVQIPLWMVNGNVNYTRLWWFDRA